MLVLMLWILLTFVMVVIANIRTLLFMNMASLLSAILLVVLFNKLLDGENMAVVLGQINKRVVVSALIRGILLAFISFSATISVFILLFNVSIHLLLSVDCNIFCSFLAVLLGSIGEELVIRGYFLKNVMKMGKTLAIIASSVAFALLHINNPGFSVTAFFFLLMAGIFLATLRLKTGTLLSAIGFHIGWNASEGCVFGFPISGISLCSIFIVKGDLPWWFVGRTFGPEEGLLGFIALILSCIFYPRVLPISTNQHSNS
ncbi:MAG: lysostaphin resistance A-like protein [Candidatus Baldrarchaeia archaeon]